MTFETPFSRIQSDF